MRKFLSYSIVFLFISMSVSAQDYATIYVYRKKKLTSTGIDFKIYVNKLEVGLVYNGGRLEYRYYKTGRINIMCGVYSEYGGTDKYDDNITLDIEKGKSYYLKGEGKKLYIVSNELGEKEFNQNSEFKGGVTLNDDKPWPGTAAAEPVVVKETKEVKETNNEIVVLSPKISEEEMKTTEATLKVSGYVNSKAKIKSVLVNNEKQVSDDLGNFSLQMKLREGLNRVTITANTTSGETIEKTFKVIRDAEESAVSENKEEVTYRGSDPFKGTNVANVSKEIKTGKYYALFIGIDSYSGTWKPLKNAVNDAKAIENILKADYKFDVIKTLHNAQATRSNIIDQLDWLVANVKENDNVLIYYSGHGELKKELNKGFWVPVDAKNNSTSNYISNSDIQTFLAAIPSKHTLLISDACFSGDIFRGNVSSIPFENSEKYYVKTYDLKSRQAISSGGLEPVMDGGKNGHSIFAYYLLQALKGNTNKYFDASQLYSKIKIPVTNNSDQSPEFNPIGKTGDEGGNFIFIKK